MRLPLSGVASANSSNLTARRSGEIGWAPSRKIHKPDCLRESVRSRPLLQRIRVQASNRMANLNMTKPHKKMAENHAVSRNESEVFFKGSAAVAIQAPSINFS